jgi:diguanylate cyclase (GGDEF)-like protein
MPEKMTLNKLEANLNFFHKMYDSVRIVDPLRKRVMEYRDCSASETREICYAYWGSGQICDNCISVRAHREQRSFMKLEHSPEEIMLVTALPIDSAEKPMVLELLKNVTDTMMIGSGDYQNGKLMSDVVKDINDMIIRDELTSLYNRRFLVDRLPVNIVSAKMSKKPLSVIFIDIDNLKTVNDTFGHAAGDKILKQAANTIRDCLRNDTDWVARYGGDEFVVCLNGTDSQGALRISERIYRRFDETKVSIQDNQITIVVSQGVVTMPVSGLSAEEIIRFADEKMYEAKKRRKTEK